MDVGRKSGDRMGAPTAAVASRKCILVLGMHRSGTSALTQALSLLGAGLPKHIMGAAPGNETGHWESEPLVALNDAVLAEAGSRWDDWRILDPAMLGPERLAHYKMEIARIITEEYGDQQLFVVKDPRICRLMPLWRMALDHLGVQVVFAIPLRNPLEVALSLEKRDGLPITHGCLLWLRYVLEAEHETRGARRVFVHYQDLLKDPARIVTHVASKVAKDWSAVKEETKREIEFFIDPELRHHVVMLKEPPHPVALYPWLWETYEAYSALVRRPTDKTAQRRLDRIRTVFDRVSAFFSSFIAAAETAELRRNRITAKSLDKELQDLRDAHARTVADHEATVAWAKSLDKELQDLRDAHARAVADHEATVASAKSLDKELNDSLKAHARTVADHEATVAWAKSLDKELNDSRDAHARTVADVAERTKILENELFTAQRRIDLLERDAALAHQLLASHSWRLTRPLRFAARLIRTGVQPLLRRANSVCRLMRSINDFRRG